TRSTRDWSSDVCSSDLRLFLVVGQGRLDRVFREHRAVDLDRRELQLVDDIGVLDLGGLVDRLALEPLGGQARRRDRAAAAEGLRSEERRVGKDGGWMRS